MHVYCALTSQNKIAVLNEELEVLNILELNPHSGPKSLFRDQDVLFSVNIYDGSVAKINLSENKIIQKHVCSYPTSIIKKDGNLFLTCGETDFIYITDEDLNVQKIFASRGFPVSLDIYNDLLGVALLYAKQVAIYNISTQMLLRTILIDGFPNCIYFYDEKIYIVYSDEGYFSSGFLEVFDMEGKSLEKTTTGSMPTKILCIDDNLYCLNTGSDSISIYDKKDLTLKKVVDGISMPGDIVCLNGYIYVSCMLDGGITKLDLNGNITSEVKLGEVNGITN